MSTSIAGAEVRGYLEAIRTHLNDLPPDDREELLEDLEEHLLEVAAEDEGTLEQRIGPPANYAEELRASAGLPSREQLATESPLQRAAARIVRSAVWRSATGLVTSTAGRSAIHVLRDLQPGWWVLRGYLAVLATTVVLSDYPGIGSARFRDNLPLPLHEVAMTAGVLAVALVVVLSVWLGRRARRNAIARNLSIGLSIAVGVGMLGALGGWAGDSFYYSGEEVGTQEGLTYLHHEDGSPIANICPYSTDGNLLSGVLLFDTRGRAITNTLDECCVPLALATPTIKNVYPRAVVMDEIEPGVHGPVSCPPSIAAQPQVPTSPGPGVPTIP